MSTNVVDRVVSEVSRDLVSGRWDDRYGQLKSLDALDVAFGSLWQGLVDPEECSGRGAPAAEPKR